MKVYLSSTYMDLRAQRSEVALSLRKAGYEVKMMEEYTARDQVVEVACKDDVVASDVYVGIFAWRYGYVPEDDNPERKSVTEIEHSAAVAKPIPCLLFLIKDGARWPEKSTLVRNRGWASRSSAAEASASSAGTSAQPLPAFTASRSPSAVPSARPAAATASSVLPGATSSDSLKRAARASSPTR